MFALVQVRFVSRAPHYTIIRQVFHALLSLQLSNIICYWQKLGDKEAYSAMQSPHVRGLVALKGRRIRVLHCVIGLYGLGNYIDTLAF